MIANVNDDGTPAVGTLDPDLPAARISVIVIGFDDARHIGAAVRSALAQGPVVAEVVAVDDASTDGTGAILDRLAAQEPRLRVVHRRVNSGGCGTPRNDGLRAATSPYVMFLDSDDVLPTGAAAALLRAALQHDAPVAAGLCVRRELPQRRDTRWQPGLYRTAAVHDRPEAHAALLPDTLCVNKLYARAFLTGNGIAFPEGPYRYEDFVFTARVLAAGPRVATVPDAVYIWHVRRNTDRPSLSLDRDRIGNWQARVLAHQHAVEILRGAGGTALAQAARVKFLDHDLRMYVRELPSRGPAYRRAWWRVARGCLAAYGEAEFAAARAPARWIARVLLAAGAPRDLERLAQLAARPARLLPPYAAVAGLPVWARDLPAVVLDGLTGPGAKPVRRLPVTVDAGLRTGPARAELRLRVHDLYGRLAQAGPRKVTVELRLRGGEPAVAYAAPLTPEGAAVWGARLYFGLGALAAQGSGGGTQVWDVRVHLHCGRSGAPLRTAVRATGPGLRRTILPSARHGVLLARPYATATGSLALRLAPGVRGAVGVVGRRVRRWFRAP
ncbi:glycosyltransferase family 2 protein [Streptomyces sp. NPDC002536]